MTLGDGDKQILGHRTARTESELYHELRRPINKKPNVCIHNYRQKHIGIHRGTQAARGRTERDSDRGPERSKQNEKESSVHQSMAHILRCILQ